MGIFTHTSISPSPLLRQRPSRYAIRAGRNLPDKEFRYLRTVIVTAAVYWGFNSSAYTSALAFANTCVFAKQSLGPILCGLFRGTPYPEVTGSFCRVP